MRREGERPRRRSEQEEQPDVSREPRERGLKWPREAGPILAAAKLEVRLLVVLYQAAKESVCFCFCSTCGHVVNADALSTCP